MGKFSLDLIEDWIDEERVDSFDRLPKRVGFSIKLLHIPATVIVRVAGESLQLEAQVTFDPEELANLLDRPQLMNQFRTEAMIVLTNLRGFYAFLDDEYETTNFEEMRHIRLQYFMYFDGASQHEFMNSMYDLARTQAYLQFRPKDILDQLDGQT